MTTIADHVLLVIATGAPTFYLVLTLVECACEITSIRRAVRGVDGGRHSNAARLTALGRYLAKEREQLDIKLRSIEFQLKEALLKAAHLEQDPFTRIGNELKADELGRTRFFESILELIRARSRAAAAAVIFFDEVNGVKDGIYKSFSLQLHFGQRQRQILKALVQERLGFDPSCRWGLIDASDLKSKLADISQIGLRYVYFQSLQLKAASGEAEKAVIAFFFKDGEAPSNYEIEAITQMGLRIERDFQDAFRINQLTDKIVEAEKRDKERSDFITHVSHDIRSPLNNISAILTLFLDSARNQNDARILKAAISNCTQVTEIVEDVLDFSRHQAGKLQARFERLCLNECIEEVVEMHSYPARVKGLELRLKQDEARGCVIFADRKHVKRVMGNLLSNAIKYTPSGWVEVAIQRVDKNSVQITVADSGIGMSKEQLDLLFTPFTRFSNDASEGVGIGLSLSKILLNLNHGSIRVDSQLGRGSKFIAALPLLEHGDAGLDEGVERAIVSGVRRARILLADDDGDLVESLARIMLKRGHSVKKCFSTADAIEQIKGWRPDRIITDGSMPGGGATKILRYMQGAQMITPLLILSGQEGLKESLSPIPAWTTFVKKPCDYQIIEQWLQSPAPFGWDEPRPHAA